MIVTAWIIPPCSPHADLLSPHPGIERVIFKEATERRTAEGFKFDVEVRIIGNRPDVRVEFGPVSQTGFHV